MNRVKLKTALMAACACIVAASASAASRAATEAWVTNRIAQAGLASTNYVDAATSGLLKKPSAPEVTTALRWRADGTACVVSVAAGGTLMADTSEWTEGQAVMAVITLAEGAGIQQGIELVGYGAWPVGTPFVACCYRFGLTVFVVPSTTL